MVPVDVLKITYRYFMYLLSTRVTIVYVFVLICLFCVILWLLFMNLFIFLRWLDLIFFCLLCSYCLNELPATFDEFVYWFCDDCDVEMPQHFGPLLNTEPIQLKNGDYVNSKHGKPNSEERSFKRKKTGNMILDTADNLPQDQSPEDDFPRKMDSRRKIKKVSDSIMEHNRHQSGDVNAELDASVNYNQGAEFCPLNKSNKKKRVVSTLSTDLQGRTPPEQPGFGLGHLSGDGTLYNYELAQPLADPIWR